MVSPSVGYSASISGTTFLPYNDAERIGIFVLGATQRTDSEALKKIVGQGVDTIRKLIDRLDDTLRSTSGPLRGMTWMSFTDEYDFNARTRINPPLGVNRDEFENAIHPNSHALTVGNLCFVAIGQIVNRSSSATRYQPTGAPIVNSPTYSARLRTVIVADWSGLTVEKHRQQLI